MHTLLGILCCLGSFGFIIFIHEMGHYLTALRSGVYCPSFAIGFGPVLIGFRRWGTHFSLRLFPIGGYVHMVGEDPASDQASWNVTLRSALEGVEFPVTPRQLLEQLPPEPELREVREHLANLPPDRPCERFEDLDGNFNHRSYGQRMLIILGGVAMNFVAACLLLWFLGFTVGIGDISSVSMPRVGRVRPLSAAERAGLKPDDVVMMLNGHPILSGDDLQRTMSKLPGAVVHTVYRRGGQNVTTDVTADIKVGPLVFSGVGQDVKMVDGADDLGIANGDVVVSLNNQTVTDPASFVKLLEKPSAPMVLGVRGKTSQVTLKKAYKAEGRLGIEMVTVQSIAFARDRLSQVVGVQAGSVAEKLGFRAGDQLELINSLQVKSGADIDAALGRLQEGDVSEVSFFLVRDQKGLELKLSERPPGTAAAMGLQLQPVNAQVILTEPLQKIWFFVKLPVEIVHALSDQRITAKELKESSQGPVGMMQMLYELSDNGWADILWFLAFLNCAVGAFNLIPFPALDGARELILLFSAIRGRNINPEKEALFHLGGLAVLLCLVLSITYQDIQRLLAGTPIMK